MAKVDLSDWRSDQIDEFCGLFHELKKIYGEKSLGLTPEQRDIAEQLGLMPPPTALVEVAVDGKQYRGLLRYP